MLTVGAFIYSFSSSISATMYLVLLQAGYGHDYTENHASNATRMNNFRFSQNSNYAERNASIMDAPLQRTIISPV